MRRAGDGLRVPARAVRLSTIIQAVALAGGLAACGASGPEQLRVSVEADKQANNDSAVAVAVLVVYDDAELAELRKKSAREWFAEMEQRQRDNPDGSKFDLLAWELMPGQRIREKTVELRGIPAEGLVFADYYSEGEHREAFNPARRIQVQLLKDRFTIVYRSDDEDEEPNE